MLRRSARLCVSHPKAVLAGVLVFLALCVVGGANVSEKLGVAGFTDPNSDSTRAGELIDEEFGSTPNFVVEVVATQTDVDDPTVAAFAERVARLIAADKSATVIGSYWTTKQPDLRSRDGTSGIIAVHIGGSENGAAKTTRGIIDALPPDNEFAEVRPGGPLGIEVETEQRVASDLLISESIAVPVTLLFLIVVFGGLVAAFLPVVLGIASIVATVGVLAVLTSVTDVSVHALTVASAFGLGLSIDFGLLMISRFREERAAGRSHDDAIVAMVESSGRTIGFSAATVALAMGGMLVFPTYFLRSVGLAASTVVVLSALSAIVVMPAVLALLGPRIDALQIIRRKKAVSAESAFWRRCAQIVIRRPVALALPVIALLLAAGIPFLHAEFATPDERALPASSTARIAVESLRDNYPADTSSAITIVADRDGAALSALSGRIAELPGVARVDGPLLSEDSGYLLAQLSVSAQSAEARDLVNTIRESITTNGELVGGPTAVIVDSSNSISSRLGIAIALMASATFVLLFLFTGSIVVPIKALTMNVFVLSAVLGVMVLIFQDGHLSSLLGVTPSPLGLPMVVLLCCIAFSLSVDYEIFLLSRIKEARQRGLTNETAIVSGLSKVGRIISSAAILLTITLVSFANGLSFMKMFGIGTALAVVLDATVIRGIVVPAFLRLAGDVNWWAPKPLRRLHAKIGFSESAAPALPRTEPPATATVRRQVFVRPPAAHVSEATNVVERPVQQVHSVSLGRIVIDDSTRFDLDQDCIIGRDPLESASARTGFRAVRIDDPERRLSRVHAEIRLVNESVYIVDRASRNGTFVRSASSTVWTRLDPWSAEVWRPGLMVKVGEHVLRLEPAGQVLSAGVR